MLGAKVKMCITKALNNRLTDVWCLLYV